MYEILKVLTNLINYKGDISVHLVRKFDVLPDFFCNWKLSEKGREAYNSMKTSDLYRPEDSAAGEIAHNFNGVIKRNIKI